MFEEITPEGIRQGMAERMGVELDIREGSYTGDMLSAAAYEIWKIYQSLNALIPIAFVDETSGEYIDKRCAEYGITRKSGTKARGKATFFGADGTRIPKGTILLTASGLEFFMLKSVQIVEGSASGEIEAAAVGTSYNAAAGYINSVSIGIPGLTSVSGGATSGGTDPETDKDLVERLYRRLRNPATSGNSEHYRQWALEVPGVGAAKVTPLWDGPGTVKVLIVDQNRRPAAASILEACAKNIEAQRPIGAAVTIKSAEGLEINVSASVILESTASTDTVNSEFSKALEEYIRQSAFEKYEIFYNRIAFILMDVPGVTDYSSLTVNGGMDNICIGADQVPLVGEVKINAV